MHCELSQIIAYRHPAVVARFKKEHPKKADRALEVFEDLLRFFWGTFRHRHDLAQAPQSPHLNFVYIMDDEMRDIDLMWHVFLLYTRDYAQFCQEHFSEFLHHQPDLVPLFEDKGFEFESNLEKFLNYNFDLFGETVIKRWFSQSTTPQEAVAT